MIHPAQRLTLDELAMLVDDMPPLARDEIVRYIDRLHSEIDGLRLQIETFVRGVYGPKPRQPCGLGWQRCVRNCSPCASCIRPTLTPSAEREHHDRLNRCDALKHEIDELTMAIDGL